MSAENQSAVSHEQRLFEAIAEYLSAAEAGQDPDRSQFVARFPDLATELHAFFEDHDRMHAAAGPVDKFDTPCPAPSEAPTLSPGETAPGPSETGQRFGHYELLEEIARGGMGVVYKARHVHLGRTVALKMVRAGQFASADERERFQAEAQAAAELDHPNIVPIYEVGEHQGQPYFTMKLVEGGSLAQALSGSGRQSAMRKERQRWGAELLAKAARAVHYAHQRRILHRDLKPANILLDAQDEPHLTDFGLAKRVAGGGGRVAGKEGHSSFPPPATRHPSPVTPLTQSGVIVGTPSYMAPEQAQAKKNLSTAVDVYSLGAVLYEILTGRPPFAGEKPLDTIIQLLDKDPPRPRTLNPHVDRDLETICLKCLEKDPLRRYGSAEALAEDLERWLAGEPIQARPSSVAERMVKWARRRPSVATLTALLACSIVAGVAGIYVKWQDAMAAEAQASNKAEDAEKAKGKAEAEAERARTARNQEALARQQEARAKTEAQTARAEAEKDRDAKYRVLLRADGLRLAAEASAARHYDPALSLLLAHEAVARVPNHLTYNILYDALNDCREERTLQGFKGAVKAVRFTPDGRFLVTVADTDANNSVARVWDVATGKVAAEWKGYATRTGIAALSPDGKKMAVTMEGHQAVYYRDGKVPPKHVFTDRTTYVWDVATGKDLVHLRRHDDRVCALAFSPDGSKIATGSWDNTAKIWDAATGKELQVLKGHQCSIRDIQFSPDGHRLITLSSARNDSSFKSPKEDAAGQVVTDPGVSPRKGRFGESETSHASMSLFGETPQARLWDVASGKQLTDFRKRAPTLLQFGHVWHPTAAAFSPDGKRLAVAFLENDVGLWDAEKGGWEVMVLKGHEGAVHALAFSPDGTRLATSGQDKTVRLWDSTSGKETLRLRGHEAAVKSVQFRPDGKLLLSTSEDKSARLWDPTTGEEKARLLGHAGEVIDARFSPDGARLATAGDQTARLWRLTPPTPETVLLGHKGNLVTVEFSPDGKSLLTAAAGDEVPRLWDTATGKERLSLGVTNHLGNIHSAEFADRGRRIVTASENCSVTEKGKVVNEASVHLWDATSGTDRQALKGHQEGAFLARSSPDGRVLLTVSDGYVRTKKGDSLNMTVPKGGLSGLKLDFTRQGPGNASDLRTWDAASGKLLATFPKPVRSDFPISFSPDGKKILVAYHQDAGVHLVEAATGKNLLTFAQASAWGKIFAALCPDGRRLVTASGQSKACMWDTTTGQLLATLQGFAGDVQFAVFSPNGQRLITLAGRFGYVWDPTTRELLTVLKGHEADVLAAKFSADGKQVATGSADRSAALWDVATGGMLGYFRGHSAAVGLVALSPDGKHLATGSSDGTARLWPTDLMPFVASREPRPLTPAEKDRFEVIAWPANPRDAKDIHTGDRPEALPSAVPPPGAKLSEAFPLKPGPLSAEAQASRNDQLRGLQHRAAGVKTDDPVLRKDILSFIQTNPGTDPARLAAELLTALPSPLDGLDPSHIPAGERFAWQPRELVAVVGEHRQRHWGWVNRVVAGPTGKFVASADVRGGIQVWEFPSMKLKASLLGNLAGFTPDERTLITATEELLQLWSLAGPEIKSQATYPLKNKGVLALSPDAKTIVLRGDGDTVAVWDLGRTPPVAKGFCIGHSEYVGAAAFSPDGRRLATGSGDKSVRLWDVAGGKLRELAVLADLGDGVKGVDFAADGKLLAAGTLNKGLRVWDLSALPPRQLAVTGKTSHHSCMSVAFSPIDGTLAVGDWTPHAGYGVQLLRVGKNGDGTLNSGVPSPFFPNGLTEIARLPRQVSSIDSLAFGQDGRWLVSGGYDKTVRVWDMTSTPPREKNPLQGHVSSIVGLAFSPTQPILATSAEDETTRLWDLRGGEFRQIQVLPGGRGQLAFSPDGTGLASGSDQVRLWDVTSGAPREKASLPSHRSYPYALAWSPDGHTLATARTFPSLRLWDVRQSPPRQRAVMDTDKDQNLNFHSVAFSPDGRVVVAGREFVHQDEPLRVWRITEQGLQPLAGPMCHASLVAYSPDGQSLACCGGMDDMNIHLLDLSGPAASERAVLEGHSRPGWARVVKSFAFSLDGRRLVSAGDDGRVFVWDTATGKSVHQWQLPGAVEVVAFAPDGRHLATANCNGTVYVLRIAGPRP